MAPHSSTLAWKIPRTEGLVDCSPCGRYESDTTERRHFHFSLSCIGEGNGNPLQCSCLENPRDGGAWWAAIYRVAQSRTRLRQHSSSSSIITLISQMVELLHRKVKSFAQVYTTSVRQSQGLSPNPLKLIAFRSMKCLFLTSLQLALLPSLPSQE